MPLLCPYIPESWDLEGPCLLSKYRGSVPNGILWSAHNRSSEYEKVCRRRERGSRLSYPLTTPSTGREGRAGQRGRGPYF